MKPLDRPTLILIRHGDTQLNDRNLLRGWDDPPLNPDGHKDAHEAAEKVARLDVPIHHVYTGTLQRTVETGKHVSARIGVESTRLPGLNPWDYGDFTGQPENANNRKKLKFYQDRPQIKTPNGESYADFLKRYGYVLHGAADYVHKFPEKALVLVTHSRNLYPTPHLLDGKSPIPTKDSTYGPGTVHKAEFDPSGSRKVKITKL